MKQHKPQAKKYYKIKKLNKGVSPLTIAAPMFLGAALLGYAYNKIKRNTK